MSSGSPALLLLDVGNSRIKAALVWEGRWVSIPEEESAGQLARTLPGIPDHIVVSSVRNLPENWSAEISAVYPKATFDVVSPLAPSFLLQGYETPETLGVDRWLGVHGARLHFPAGRLLVLDIGTALTYDYLTASDTYLGGGISPGLRMRYQALHAYTARLPLLATPPENLPDLVGASTAASIHSGVIRGMDAEMNGICQAYRALEETPLAVLLTGGDADRFENQLGCPNFVAPELVLHGLFAWVHYRYYGQIPTLLSSSYWVRNPRG